TTWNGRAGAMITLYAPEEAFNPLALPQSHDRLLPVGRAADVARARAAPRAALFAAHGHGVDSLDRDVLRLVLLLEGLFDLGLGRDREDFERVPALRVELVGALGDHGADHDLGGCAVGHQAVSSSLPRELKFSSSSSMVSF